jgi:hypothetical protein
VVVVDDDVSEEFCDGCGVVSILTVGVVSDCFCVVWVFPGLETGGAGVDTPGEEGWELGGGGGGGAVDSQVLPFFLYPVMQSHSQ